MTIFNYSLWKVVMVRVKCLRIQVFLTNKYYQSRTYDRFIKPTQEQYYLNDVHSLSLYSMGQS